MLLAQVHSDPLVHGVSSSTPPPIHLRSPCVPLGITSGAPQIHPSEYGTYSRSPASVSNFTFTRLRTRQHNGELTQGAKKTRTRRPWVMQMIVYGFPSKLVTFNFFYVISILTRLEGRAAIRMGVAAPAPLQTSSRRGRYGPA